MKRPLVALCAALCAGSVQADPRFIEDPRIIDLQVGIVCPGPALEVELTTGSDTGRILRYEEYPDFDHPGRIVPAIGGITFTAIAQAAPGVQIASTTRTVTHPPHPDTGAVAHRYSGEPIADHQPTLIGYRFSARTALQMLGVWTVAIEDDNGQVLFEVAFELVHPGDAPFVVATCD